MRGHIDPIFNSLSTIDLHFLTRSHLMTSFFMPIFDNLSPNDHFFFHFSSKFSIFFFFKIVVKMCSNVYFAWKICQICLALPIQPLSVFVVVFDSKYRPIKVDKSQQIEKLTKYHPQNFYIFRTMTLCPFPPQISLLHLCTND